MVSTRIGALGKGFVCADDGTGSEPANGAAAAEEIRTCANVCDAHDASGALDANDHDDDGVVFDDCDDERARRSRAAVDRASDDDVGDVPMHVELCQRLIAVPARVPVRVNECVHDWLCYYDWYRRVRDAVLAQY